MTPEARIEQELATQTAWLDQLLRDHLHRIEDTFSTAREMADYEASMCVYRDQALAALESQLLALIGRLH